MLSTKNIGKPPEEQIKPVQQTKVQSSLWTSKSAAYESALTEIITRRDNPTGIYNLKTPWSVINDITFGGIQWQTLNVFAGRPGSGKTLIKDQLLRYATEHQPNVRILEFQLEMSGKQHSLRDLSAFMHRPVKELMSYKTERDTYPLITDEEIQRMKNRAEYMSNRPWNYVTNSPTVPEMEHIIREYRNTYHNENIIIAVDHGDLISEGNSKSKNEKMYKFCETITALNMQLPNITFIVLAQMNRSIEEPSRMEPGRIGNYPTANDIFGADAYMQHASLVTCINRPRQSHIAIYGPNKFLIPVESNDKAMVAWHIIKNRSGVTGMSFFEAHWNEMSMQACDAPPVQEQNISTKNK